MQGLIHYHQNLACEPAKYFGVLDHRDPGTQTTMPNLLRAPLSILRGALGVDDATIAKLQAAAVTLVIDPVCVERCGGGGGDGGGGDGGGSTGGGGSDGEYTEEPDASPAPPGKSGKGRKNGRKDD